MMVPNEIPNSDEPARTGKTRMADLWVPSVRKMLILGSVVMALGFIVYYGLSANYVAMLMTDHALDYQSAFLHIIVFNVGMLIGVLCAGIVANRWGVIVALVTPALLMVPALALYCGLIPGPGLWIGAFLGGALGAGYSGVTPVLTTSLFPAHVRARAIGLVYHAGALIAAFTPFVITEIAANTQLTLSGAIAVVVGSGLVLMATAVLVLRRHIILPEKADPGVTLAPVPAPVLAIASAAASTQLATAAALDRHVSRAERGLPLGS